MHPYRRFNSIALVRQIVTGKTPQHPGQEGPAFFWGGDGERLGGSSGCNTQEWDCFQKLFGDDEEEDEDDDDDDDEDEDEDDDDDDDHHHHHHHHYYRYCLKSWIS